MELDKNIKSRDVRIDLIRIFSLFLVIGIHFFLNSDFYTVNVYGGKMLIMCIFRSFFIISVPMFITLTGYLMNKKTLTKSYYKGIVKTLIIYILCSIMYSFFAKYYLKVDMDFKIFIENILSYSGTAYSWYIEMYIGLFMIIPFLNLIFNNLKSQREAKYFLITLIILIGIPNSLNIFRFDSLEWWKMPIQNNKYVKLIPSWWTATYPIFYYFLGAYLKKYQNNMNIVLNFVLLVSIVILDGTFNFYRSHGTQFIWASWNNYSSATVMLITYLTFSFLLNALKIKENKVIRDKIFKTLADACLGGYLISCCFDIVFYNKLKLQVPDVMNRFVYAPVMVILVLIASLMVSVIINYIYNFLNKIILRFFKSRLKTIS